MRLISYESKHYTIDFNFPISSKYRLMGVHFISQMHRQVE